MMTRPVNDVCVRFGGPASLPAVVVLAALACTAAWAHSPVDPVGVSPGHPTGHVTDRDGVTWPPQPRGMRNVVPLGGALEQARSRKSKAPEIDREERAVLRSRDVRRALGNRFERLDGGWLSGKGADSRVRHLVYFSHARNATVEIFIDESGARRVRTTPAAEYQPEITDAEIEQAGKVARAYFLAQGYERVASLEAFGILAYKPEGKGFYSTRVLYISFHPNSDAAPEYEAWVDLTRNRVLRSREERP